MRPAVVIYPTNVDDIALAVKYARENDVGIAVRTGGHQYSGASSTSGDNIQLDLSDTFESDDDFSYDSSTNKLRMGVSFSLNEMNERLRKEGLFLPHGQCLNVHVGGHVQTGGYGQLSRAFGLLSDHVEGFEIVLANGEYKKVWKPNGENVLKEMTKDEKELNDDLYWAVLGGSPGNYGILTHVTLQPHKDKDHPDSRGMKLVTRYSKKKLEKVLEVMTRMNDDNDLPADFDVCVTVASDFYNHFGIRKLFGLPAHYKNLDEKMASEFPEEYADGVPWAEKGKKAARMAVVPVIKIYLSWSNLEGSNQKFGEKEREWFDAIKTAMSPTFADDGGKCFANCFEPTDKFIKRMRHNEDVRNFIYVDHEVHTPMSILTRFWCYEDVREYVKPYEKRVFVSNKTDLSSNGWIQWVSNRIDKIAKMKLFNNEYKSLDVIAQLQPFGGTHSRFRINGSPELHHGCHSWRQEITMGITMDCFYQPKDDKEDSDKSLKKAMEWQAENDKESAEGGLMSNEDMRLLWGSYARAEDLDGGANLHTVREKYYDSEEKYQKLVSIKRKVDPQYVFTANSFGIDANNAPEHKQIQILGRGHKGPSN